MNYTHDKCYGDIVDKNAQDSDNFYRSLYEGLGVDNVWLYVLSGGIGYKYYKSNLQKDAPGICNYHILDKK
ncbi:4936_t:CDS:1, partial [Dentiscutata erythropus]